MLTQLENLNRQLRIGDVISTLMAQSTKLIEIVNANQKEINRLKEESDQLQTHMDNAIDHNHDKSHLEAE
jgi:hypothetical protein